MIVRAERVVFPLNDYPTSDGKPMAETDQHRKLLNALVEALDEWFAADPAVYVSGNLLLFYEKGDKRRHVSPDVFVVSGVPKGIRPNYLVWQEKKTPDVVITSNTPGQGNFPADPHYLAPPMPWPAWRHMSDGELWDIVAYLQHGIKPVSNKVQDSDDPPDYWASAYTPDQIGLYPLPPYPAGGEEFKP